MSIDRAPGISVEPRPIAEPRRAVIVAPATVIEGLRGVGRVELTLDEGRSVYLFAGANGVGKTKALEALFQATVLASDTASEASVAGSPNWAVFERLIAKGRTLEIPQQAFGFARPGMQFGPHRLPSVFLGSQGRGFVASRGRNRPTPTSPLPTIAWSRSNRC